MNLYVGNLAYQTTEEEIQAVFAPFGKVEAVRVATERFSGRAKGFGFVEMPDSAEADAAIKALNGKDLGGRRLTVNQARLKDPESRGGRQGPSRC